MKFHMLRRELIGLSGFENADRSGERVYTKPHTGVRLLVNGSAWPAGFGIGYVDTNRWYNQGEGRPTTLGPDLHAYGRAGVIDNYGGTAGEIEREGAQGLVIRADIGDIFLMQDPAHPDDLTAWELAWDGWGNSVDRHNVRFFQVDLRVRVRDETPA
jgi:hypothetical protein